MAPGLNRKLASSTLLLALTLTASSSHLPKSSNPPPPTTTPCKAVQGSPDWPSASQWSQLSEDLSGQLLTPLPPAIVCDPSKPSTYDQQKCDFVGSQWENAPFLSNDPVSAHYPNWQNDACLPTAVYNGSSDCDTTQFPMYVVNATSASDIATAVKFAAQNNVRLSIRGTGHDFLGRSSSPGLSIWTHNVRGMDVLPSFKPTGCTNCEGTPAVTVSAGHINCEIYQKTKPSGLIPAVGTCAGVGIGGYLQGGGHGPISVKHGLAVDNVLEIVLVTAAGDIVTANDYQNQDLFWALKGGGGGTFGVLVSAVLKTLPDSPVAKISMQFTSTLNESSQNNNSNWYSALAYFHTQIPKLTDNYITGYYGMIPYDALNSGGYLFPFSMVANSNADTSGPMYFYFTGWGLDMSKKKANALLAPLKNRLKSDNNLVSQFNIRQENSIYDIIKPCGGDHAGYNMILGSRLWDKPAVTDQESLIQTFRSLNPPVANGYLVAGPGVRDTTKINSTSVTPAWRRAYLHINTALTFDYRNDTDRQLNEQLLTFKQTEALRNHAPNMGAYTNEADVREPNYQQAFWGSNYKRLLSLKRRYDPGGVFWCPACVGSEDWRLDPDTGTLCRVH